MLQRRFGIGRGQAAGRGRRARLVAAGALPVMLVAIGLQSEPAFAGTSSAGTVPAPTCQLNTSNITVGTSTSPGGIQLIAQDATSGIKKLISPYHINATAPVLSFTPGDPNPVTADFTQISGTDGSSGSLKVINEAKQKTICLGQFKTLIPGGRADSNGFSFPQDRNMLVIQNGNPGLSSVQITLNSVDIAPEVDLTPGQLLQMPLTGLVNFPPLNELSVTPTGDRDASAEVVVWGVGPFYYGYPDE